MKNLSVRQLVQKSHDSHPVLATLSALDKDKVLLAMALALRSQKASIIKENNKDVSQAGLNHLSAALKDRLLLNEKRIEEMAFGLEDVSHLPDPVGQVVKEWTRPNGIRVCKVRIPLGVIGVVYESRPNVTVDAAALCFKAGNAVILRGGKEAIHSNLALGKVLQGVLLQQGIPKALITVIPTTDREVLKKMLNLTGLIDLIIPRGGEGLMKFMGDHSKIPVLKHDKGVCSLYIDESADEEMALSIAENSKVQRPGVCNAVENLFVHEKIAPTFLPRLRKRLEGQGVEIRGDLKAIKILKGINKAKEEDWYTEYLDLILAVGVVKDIDEAIRKIQKYGSHHTESIVTRSETHATKFISQLNSSCVLVNASTRFNDGGQLGLGAEIGISTTKLHAFGPMGLEELTTTKFVVRGEGQIRT